MVLRYPGEKKTLRPNLTYKVLFTVTMVTKNASGKTARNRKGEKTSNSRKERKT